MDNFDDDLGFDAEEADLDDGGDGDEMTDGGDNTQPQGDEDGMDLEEALKEGLADLADDDDYNDDDAPDLNQDEQDELKKELEQGFAEISEGDEEDGGVGTQPESGVVTAEEGQYGTQDGGDQQQGPSSRPPQAQALQDERSRRTFALMSMMSDEQLNRYEAYKRSQLPRPKVKKLMQSLTSYQPHERVIIAVCGVAKIFAGQLIETARRIADKEGHTGPLLPHQVQQAYQELDSHSKWPSVLSAPSRRMFPRRICATPSLPVVLGKEAVLSAQQGRGLHPASMDDREGVEDGHDHDDDVSEDRDEGSGGDDVASGEEGEEEEEGTGKVDGSKRDDQVMVEAVTVG